MLQSVGIAGCYSESFSVFSIPLSRIAVVGSPLSHDLSSHRLSACSASVRDEFCLVELGHKVVGYFREQLCPSCTGWGYLAYRVYRGVRVIEWGGSE